MKRRKKQVSRPKRIDPATPSGMYPYLLQFLEDSGAKGLTATTVATRRVNLSRFLCWCMERNLERPQDITRPILERYRRHVYYTRKPDGKPLAYGTQQQRLQPLRTFFRWLTLQNHILSNPASEMELPRVHRRLPRHILKPEEIARVLKQTSLRGVIGIRDRAIVETFYSTGIRRTELINLKLYDVDTSNGTVMVREGKGRKDRMVPLGQRAAHWIDRYLDEVRAGLVVGFDEGILFLHEYGEAFSKNRLGDLMKQYLLKAGVEAEGSCHLYRHAMATHMLDHGADIRFIQAILGHANLSTTEIYTQVSIKQLQDVHARTHPADLVADGEDDV